MRRVCDVFVCHGAQDGTGAVQIATATTTNPYNIAYHRERTIGWRAGCHCQYPCADDHANTALTVYWFNGCTALRSIVIPSTIEVVSSCSFNGTGLTSLTLPDSVHLIGWQSFANNANLGKDCGGIGAVCGGEVIGWSGV